MKVDYILTTFSPAMFGEGTTAHFRIITPDDAAELAGESTKIVATRVGHDRLARNQFPHAAREVARYAALKPGTTAIHIHYRGPQVPDTGDMPLGSRLITTT